MSGWKKIMIMMAAAILISGCQDESNGSKGNQPEQGGESGDETDRGDGSVTPGDEGHGGGTEQTPSTSCDSYEALCGGVCVDVMSSSLHCGDCDTKCTEGMICMDGKCTAPCRKPESLCGSQCVNLMQDRNNCGTCGTVCGANMACDSGACTCEKDFIDQNGDAADGCEFNLNSTCEEGQVSECYSYQPETKGVGECRSGMMKCELTDGMWWWGKCNDVGPKRVYECTEKDYDCNGIPDGEEDRDGDGYSICDGDCCDSPEHCRVSNPEAINPGMSEVEGDGYDNNCDGRIDETPDDKIDSLTPITYTYNQADLKSTALALTRAMGIVDECPKDGACNYGLVSAELRYSGSDKTPDPRQVNVMNGMADTLGVKRVLPREGDSFAVLSSGIALDAHDGLNAPADILGGKAFTDDFMNEKQVGDDVKIEDEVVRVSQYSKIPEEYRIAHDGKLQTHEKCPTGKQKPAVFDSVNLHLTLKAPANAKGFSFDFRFFSREYPKYLCSKFNDFFLAMSSSKHEEMSKYPDRNIAFDELKNPVSVNNGFFTSCDKPYCSSDDECPKFMSCTANYCQAGENTCRDGALAVSAYYPEYYSSVFNTSGRGGGTAWLHTTAPVMPGETFDLDFHIWDTGDNKYDSTVILDNFKWELNEVKVGTDFVEIN